METLNCSQKEAQKHLDKQRLLQNNTPVHKSQTIVGEATLTYFKPQSIAQSPLWITPYFAVYDKPPKMLIHPKGYFLHLSLIDGIKSDFGKEANPVHRLDYETSGLVVISKSKQHEAPLKELFAKQKVHKQYIALVKGHIRSPQEINLPICIPSKSDKYTDLGIRCKVSAQGKPSITQITPIHYDKARNATLLQVTPLTGRTHQIRVHLSHIGHQIIGDSLYGVEDRVARGYLASKSNNNDTSPILMLHAQSLKFCYKNIHYHIKSHQNLNAKFKTRFIESF
ncbi:RluA family pseudouridine synthase [Helicobacter sp. 12S02634-8]|uniref:RluA family pseudouridine synthase n=1 Tax=Helicobacter sp. 12S02634-8 TaxID=1476199 RepID=UPI00209BEA84|nr:RluA family pseudouridine synthase [Helicobacter sp. 12S02634-8]